MAWLSTEFYFCKESAPCRAVWMTLKALSVEVEEKTIDLLKAENKKAWFVKMNMMHTVPTLNDQSYIIWESRAIMQYLCNKYCTVENQHLYPRDSESRGKVDRFLFFDMGTLYYAIKEYFGPKMYQGLPPDPEKENLLKQSIDYLDGFLEKSEGPYVCGEKMTIADLSLLASITELDAMEYSYRCYGEVSKWSDKLKSELPYFKECNLDGIKLAKARVKDLEEQAKKERKGSLSM